MKPTRDDQLELFNIEVLAKSMPSEQLDAWMEGYALGDPVARKLYRLWSDRGMETYYL